jgi:AcrR family transcriptional regulator
MARVSDAHLEARRQSILAAATRLFSQKGIAAATMAEIAAEAGISPGAIYRYFDNKEELARGCMDVSNESVKHAWKDPASTGLPFEELSRLTFAELNSPECCTDTQLFFERALIAVREGNLEARREFKEEFEKVRAGIVFLMERQFGPAPEGIDLDAIAEAFYGFYWGARVIKFIMPDVDTGAQLAALHALLRRAFDAAASR